MAFDIDTLIPIIVLIAIVHALALYISWMLNRKTPGLPYFLTAYLMMAAAVSFWAFGDTEITFSECAGNLLSVTAFLATWQGARRYYDQPSLTPIRWGTVLMLALVANVDIGLMTDSAPMRFYLTTGLLGFLAFATAYAFFVPGVENRPASLFMCAIFSGFSTYMLVRIFSYSTHIQNRTLASSNTGTPEFLLTFSAFVSLLTIGFILVVSQRLYEQFQQQADSDPLTGLFNRRAFELAGKQAIDQCARRGSDVAVIRLDIDGFKSLRDQYGHAESEKLLQSIAHLLKASFRAQDVLARLGGASFSVLMPETKLHSAKSIAERVRKSLNIGAIYVKDGTTVTASFGISSVNATTSLATLDVLTEHANHALYRAKQGGRNQVEIYGLK